MKKIIFLSLVALLAFSCAKNIEDKNTTGDIVGIVYDNSVGEPIPVAKVSLKETGKTAVTGTDGSYSFTGIEAGEYSITVTKKGYNDGSNTVTVKADSKVQCDILMERIPAYVTADKEELNFGDNESLVTLSFNIVNASYENLSWHIEYDKSSLSFISEVSPESGTTAFGKTASIVVKIDRDKLKAGENLSNLVVVSDNGDGSSEVTLKAVGKEKSKPVLNLTGVSDIKSTSATVSGQITSAGVPVYTERGFVYSTTVNPTLENTIQKLTAPVNENASFSCSISELTLGKKYYVRAFAVNKVGVAYSANQESFTTAASLPSVSMLSVNQVDPYALTAVLHGSVDNLGDPSYSEKGFVYCEDRSTPTLSDSYVKVSGSGLGTYDAKISNLTLGKTYYARAYARNEGGVVYSSTSKSFTLSKTNPVVSVQSVTGIDRVNLQATLNGSVEAMGNPAIFENGFVYSSSHTNPTINDTMVKMTECKLGTYSYTISGLSLGISYYVRAYVKNSDGITYSDPTSFKLEKTTPVINIAAATGVDRVNLKATLNGSVDEMGLPAIFENGFVYSSTNTNPTIGDSVVKMDECKLGSFSSTITGLTLGATYYIRAYAKSSDGVIYTNAVSFTLNKTAPVINISSVTGVDRVNLKATLNGTVDEMGWPAITENGFVYSNTNSKPTINDNVVKMTTCKLGTFTSTISNLTLGYTYYVRAYGRNADGVLYGSSVKSFSMSAISPTVTVRTATDINLTTLKATLSGSIDGVGDPAYTEKGFVYSTENTAPTIANSTTVTVSGTQSGVYSTTISNLVISKTYYVRAYAKNAGGTVYSSNTVNFSTVPTKPTVTIMTVGAIDFSKMTSVFKASIDNVGNPPYSEKGFVYSSSNSNPTLTNGNVIKVSGTVAGYFETTATGLEYNKTYYVKAYASNVGGVSYSNATSFNTNESLPVVITESPTNVDANNKTAVLNATISYAGTPEYYERGFVYSSSFQQPTVNDSKLVVGGSGSGSYNCRLSGFDITNKLYARAYAINHKGVSYGESVVVFDPDFIDRGEYIEIVSLGIAVQKEDLGRGSWSSMSTLCKNSRIGGYADWRLPTVSELAGIIRLHEKIGGFESNPNTFNNMWYWSSTFVPKDATHYADGYKAIRGDGTENELIPDGSSCYARAVRTKR